MPDWIAHLMLGWVVAVALKIGGARRVIFLIGNVIPDIVRFLNVLATMFAPSWFYAYVAHPINVGSHSILGVIAYGLFLSLFFKLQPERCSRCPGGTRTIQRAWHRALDSPAFLLVLGGLLHLFLDTFMWPWAGGIAWFYPLLDPPFSWSFQLWWPGSINAVVTLLPFLAVAIMVEVRRWKRGAMPGRQLESGLDDETRRNVS